MANYNLTSQQLKDTYQQLVQVSGSAIVDGTGSLVNGFDYPSNSEYNAFSSSVATILDSIVAGSGSADWALLTNKPAGLVSGSSQVDLSLAFGTASSAISASYADKSALSDYATSAGTAASANQAALVNITATSTNANYPVMFVSSNGFQSPRIDTETLGIYYNPSTNRLTTSLINGNTITATTAFIGNLTGNVTGTATSASRATSARNTELFVGLEESAFAQVGQNNIFGGAQTFNDVVINGTASIAYLQQVTGSAKIIGDAFIILNNDTPTQPKGGISVVDTGSTSTTSSFLWDGLTDDWKYEYHVGGTHESAVALFGSGSMIGVTTYPSANKLQKGTGTHHLHDSNITDDGTSVSVSTPFTATEITASTGFKGNLSGTATNATSASYALTASYALNAEGGLVAGGGAYSLKANNNLLFTASFADGIGAIALGDGANAASSASIAIGSHARIISAPGAIAIGQSSVGQNSAGSISIGIGASVGSNRADGIAIGKDSQAGAWGVALGVGAIAVPIGANDARSVAIGYNALADGLRAVAIGNGASADTEGIAIGYSVDASEYATVIGYNIANTGGGGNVAIGRSVTIGSDYTIAIGEGSISNTAGSIAIGQNASTNNSSNSVSVGANSSAQNGYATALGDGAVANNDASIAIGAQVQANSNQAIAIGTEADVLGSSVGAIALGQGAQVTGTQAIGIGQGVSTSAANEINIGNIFKYDGSSVLTLSGSIVSSSANLEVRGQLYSPTFAGSVASSTSSIDFNNGNFATLSLTSATHLGNPSNLKSGTTYTIIISSGSLIASHGSSFKFAGGTSPTYSNGTDVLTMVSDGTNLYATALTDFQ